MFELLEIEYLDIEENKENEELIKKVLEQCFKNENFCCDERRSRLLRSMDQKRKIHE